MVWTWNLVCGRFINFEKDRNIFTLLTFLVALFVTDRESEKRQQEWLAQARKELEEWEKNRQEQLEKTKESNRYALLQRIYSVFQQPISSKCAIINIADLLVFSDQFETYISHVHIVHMTVTSAFCERVKESNGMVVSKGQCLLGELQRYKKISQNMFGWKLCLRLIQLCLTQWFLTGVASPYAFYNMEIWPLNLPINAFAFTIYLKSGGLETKENHLREAW